MKVNRNDPCPCQSGKKYKKCCLLPKKTKLQKISGSMPTITDSVKVRAFASIFILVGAVVMFFGGRGLYRANDSVNWPSTDGIIISSYVNAYEDNDGDDRTIANVYYQFYSKNSGSYTNTKVAYGTLDKHAYSIVSKYPEGKKVVVYYQPNNPKVSVLEPGLKAQAWAFPGLGLLFFTLGSLVWVFIPKLIRKQSGS